MRRDHTPRPPFRHEALLYSGREGFAEKLVPFVLDGIRGGEPTLVMAGPDRLEALWGRVGDGDGLVRYVDMHGVGRNPARIIPAWTDFARSGGRMRGIGEPIWPGRDAEELVECHLHEALINRAFTGATGFWLVCPYDVAGLAPAVIEAARGTHPSTSNRLAAAERGADDAGARPRRAGGPRAPLATELPAPADDAIVVSFDRGSLSELRAVTLREGARAGLPAARVDDLTLAVSELATNSVDHGGGSGTARFWRQEDALICDVRDRGVVTDALSGRVRPGADPARPRGLWLVNQLCDLVQLRSSPATGSEVRIRMRAQAR
jgi:anti-sigma regulatory factor (Ser/Thr protein kinase)